MRAKGVAAESVKGSDRVDVRNKILNNYENGDINVLCTCDLLNEGWDSPRTEVLFMAWPTMSKSGHMRDKKPQELSMNYYCGLNVSFRKPRFQNQGVSYPD